MMTKLKPVLITYLKDFFNNGIVILSELQIPVYEPFVLKQSIPLFVEPVS